MEKKTGIIWLDEPDETSEAGEQEKSEKQERELFGDAGLFGDERENNGTDVTLQGGREAGTGQRGSTAGKENEARHWTLNSALLGGIAMVVVAVIAVFSLSFSGSSFRNISDARYEKNTYEKILWQDDVFPLLDAAYENEDYPLVMEIHKEHNGEDGSSAYYSWEHNIFMDFYQRYSNIMTGWEREMDGEQPYLGYAADAVELAGYYTEDWLDEKCLDPYNKNRYGTLTESDREKIREYREKACLMLEEVFGMDEQDVRMCAEANWESYGLTRSGVISYLEQRRAE